MFFQYHCILSSLDVDEADESPSRLAVLLGEGGAAAEDESAAGETSMASKLRLCPRDEDWSGAAAELSMADASEQREKSEGKGPADDDVAAARVDAIGGRMTLVDAADDEKEFMWSTSGGRRGRSGVDWVVEVEVIGVEQDEGVEVVCGCGCMWRCDEMASASVERDEEADDGVVIADDGSEGRACSSDPPLAGPVTGGDDDDVEVAEVEVGEKADATCGLLSRRGLGITGTDDAAAAAASCWWSWACCCGWACCC